MNDTSEITSRLGAVRAGIRRVQFLRGAFLVGLVTLSGLILSMVLHWFCAPLPISVRWLVFIIWLAVVLWAISKGFGPFFQKLDLVRVARWLEGRHPEMEERLSTSLSLSERGGGSDELVAALVAAAGRDAALVDSGSEVRAGRETRFWRVGLFVTAVGLLLAFALSPGIVGRLAFRSIAPFAEVGTVGRGTFELLPGDTDVMVGSAVEIVLRYPGKDQPQILLELESGVRVTQPFEREGEQWGYRIEPARESFRYRAQAGRAQSDRYSVTVWPLAELADCRVKFHYPDYTELPDREEALGSMVSALVGSELEISGTVLSPLDRVSLQLGDEIEAGRVEPSASGARVSWSWLVKTEHSGALELSGRHPVGGECSLGKVTLEPFTDAEPAVVLLSPAEQEIKVRPDEILKLRYQVSEDFGLGEMRLEVAAGQAGDWESEVRLPREIGESTPKLFRGTARVTVRELLDRFPRVGEFRLRLLASDRRPTEFAGPGRGASEWLIVKINERADSLAKQELTAQHEDAKSTVEKAIKDLRTAEAKMQQNRQRLVDGRQDESRDRLNQEAQELLAGANQALEEVAERMEEGIHAPEAPKVDQAREKATAAGERFQEVTLQDGREEREAVFEEALSKNREAVQQLEEVRRELERRGPQLEDLAKMESLAQAQSDLARQAEKQAIAEAAAEMASEWNREQVKKTEELKHELWSRPEALSEALNKQAETAKDLAQQAQALSAQQEALSEVAEQVASSSEQGEEVKRQKGAKEKLGELLRQEQAAITQGLRQKQAEAQQKGEALAESLSDAAVEAQAVKESLSEGDLSQTAPRAQEAAKSLAQAAAKASQKRQELMEENVTEAAAIAAAVEQLQELSQRQQQVGAAAEALAKGELGEALQQFQESAAAEGRALTEEIQGLPQLTGSSLGQAGNEAQRGSEKALTAHELSEKGQGEQSGQAHQRAREFFEQAAGSLARAAEQLSQRAEQEATREQPAHLAPSSEEALAEALQAMGEAAQAGQKAAEAAMAARRAAAALEKSALEGRAQLQGKAPGEAPSSWPENEASAPGGPGQKPSEDDSQFQQREADQGVPPELAKLGLSAADWERIQANLNRDVGAAGAEGVPADYRELVKEYFQSMGEK